MPILVRPHVNMHPQHLKPAMFAHPGDARPYSACIQCIKRMQMHLQCHPRSAALVAYGLESFVDLWASVLVLWRFWEDETTEAGMRKNHDRENRADVGIAFTVGSAECCYLGATAHVPSSAWSLCSALLP